MRYFCRISPQGLFCLA